MAKLKLLTEEEFIEKFKKEGFDLYRTENIKEKNAHLESLIAKEKQTKEVLQRGAKEIGHLRQANKEKSLRLNMFDDMMALLRHDRFQNNDGCCVGRDVMSEMINLSE